MYSKLLRWRFDFFFSFWVFKRGKQIQVFLINLSTKRFTTLMCWSINWYSDKPPFSLNVLIRLILSPKLCSWEVSAMSSLLSPAQSPAHVEIIGLNTFTASSGPQHQVSIGIWDGGQMTGQQCQKKIGKKERKKRSRKKEGGLLLQCKVKHHFKWSVWEWEQLSQSMASPGVQLPSTSVSMSSSIPLQIHPTSPIYQGSNDPTL